MFEPTGDPSAGGVPCPKCEHAVPLPAAAEAAGETWIGGEAVEPGFAATARESLGRTIHIACGSCGKHLTVGARRAGKRGRCPACGGRIQIPELHEDEDAAIEYLTAMGESERARLDLAGDWADATEEVQEVEIVTGLSPAQRGLLAVGLVVMVGLAVGLWIGILARRKLPAGKARGAAERPQLTVPDGEPNRPQPPKQRPSTRRVEPVGPKKGGPTGTLPVTPPVAPPVAPPEPREPVATVARKSWSVFAGRGYRPAPPGRIYVTLTAEITAGDKPLRLSNHGDDVLLEVAGERSPSLGSEGGLQTAFGEPRRRTVALKPGQRRRVGFVFEVPEKAAGGKLHVAGLPEVDVGWLAIGPDSGEDSPAGTFLEQPPRNLKPMLRDPVMAAVQAAPDQQLIVRKNRGGLGVSIPAAGVTGTVAPGGNGVYAAVLRHGDDALNCKLRLIDGGRRLVLYLADEPFHQLTYERQ